MVFHAQAQPLWTFPYLYLFRVINFTLRARGVFLFNLMLFHYVHNVFVAVFPRYYEFMDKNYVIQILVFALIAASLFLRFIGENKKAGPLRS